MHDQKPVEWLKSDYNQYRLKYLVEEGFSIRQIAEKMEFPKDTIARELKRLGLKTSGIVDNPPKIRSRWA